MQRYIRSASGPTRDGQWITLKSDDANTQQITGKCLDGRGSPLADSFLTLWPLTADGRLIGKQLHGRSGENGEFTFYLHPDDFDFDQIELLWIDRDPD